MTDAPRNQDPTQEPKDVDPAAQTPDTQEPTDAADGTDADVDADPEGADALGDPGKKALDTMKARLKEEKARRRELERRLAERESQDSGDADPKDADAIRAQAEREALKKANARIIRSEIKAAAAGKLADPTDAMVYLDPNDFEVDANGEVDAEEIREAIEDLITRKPYLAATARPRFQGSGDGGAARKASGPSQLTREDLKSMSPAEIVKAKREGRLKKVLSGD